MEPGNDYTRHFYEVLKVLRYYTVYQLKDVHNGANQLTELIRIEDYRGYSRGSGFNEYLRLRTSSNWQKGEQVTGLKFTKIKNVYYGDRIHNGRKNLLLFQFTNDREKLVIDYFRDFYPANKETLQALINNQKTT